MFFHSEYKLWESEHIKGRGSADSAPKNTTERNQSHKIFINIKTSSNDYWYLTGHEIDVEEPRTAHSDVGIDDAGLVLVLEWGHDLNVVVEVDRLLDKNDGESEHHDEAKHDHKDLEGLASGPAVPDESVEAGVLREVLNPLVDRGHAARPFTMVVRRSSSKFRFQACK